MITPNVNTIDTPDWSLSSAESGQVVRDEEDISQCISIIVTTDKGSDPLRPTFGCGVPDVIDRPASIAIPQIKRDIIDQVARWEPRAEVESIQHRLDESNVVISIFWRDRRTGNSNQTEVTL